MYVFCGILPILGFHWLRLIVGCKIFPFRVPWKPLKPCRCHMALISVPLVSVYLESIHNWGSIHHIYSPSSTLIRHLVLMFRSSIILVLSPMAGFIERIHLLNFILFKIYLQNRHQNPSNDTFFWGTKSCFLGRLHTNNYFVSTIIYAKI